jgi:hypothetical protein
VTPGGGAGSGAKRANTPTRSANSTRPASLWMTAVVPRGSSNAKLQAEPSCCSSSCRTRWPRSPGSSNRTSPRSCRRHPQRARGDAREGQSPVARHGVCAAAGPRDGIQRSADLAVRHYFRAYALRSRWVRDLHDVGGDLATYERRLVDEWEIAHTILRSRVGSSETDRCRGRPGALGEPRQRRLAGVRQPVMTFRHPDFRKRLTELLVTRE